MSTNQTTEEKKAIGRENYRKRNQWRILNAMLTEEAATALNEMAAMMEGESKAGLVSRAVIDLRKTLDWGNIPRATKDK